MYLSSFSWNHFTNKVEFNDVAVVCFFILYRHLNHIFDRIVIRLSCHIVNNKNNSAFDNIVNN